MNTSLIDLIHKNINMKHISCFLGEFAQGERHGAIEKPRARCGLALFDGAIELTVDGKKTLYSSGSVLFLPTGSRYSYKVLDETLKVYSVNFELFGERKKDPAANERTGKASAHEAAEPILWRNEQRW